MIVQKEHHGGPVVKKPAFQCRGCRFDSWSGNSDPTCHSVLQLLSPGTTRKMLHASEKLLCATTETQCSQTETAMCFLEKEERNNMKQKSVVDRKSENCEAVFHFFFFSNNCDFGI